MNDKDNFRKEKYEKHIASLEEQIDTLTAQLASAKGAQERQRLELLKQEEDFYKGLVSFLSHLYQELSKIQGGVLEHMSKLNNQLAGITDKRTSESLKDLNNALKVLGLDPLKLGAPKPLNFIDD